MVHQVEGVREQGWRATHVLLGRTFKRQEREEEGGRKGRKRVDLILFSDSVL